MDRTLAVWKGMCVCVCEREGEGEREREEGGDEARWAHRGLGSQKLCSSGTIVFTVPQGSCSGWKVLDARIGSVVGTLLRDLWVAQITEFFFKSVETERQ